MFEIDDQFVIENEILFINGELGRGAYGVVFRAKRCSDGKSFAIKQQFATDSFSQIQDEMERTEFISAFDLSTRLFSAASPLSVVPQDQSDGLPSYLMPLASGVSLREFIDTEMSASQFPLMDNIVIGAQVCGMLARLHQLGLVHGDLHLDNILVDTSTGLPRVTLIDFDNFVAENMPFPKSPGHRLFLAPEAMKRFLQNKPCFPDEHTERVALAKLAHILLYGRHVLSMTPREQYDVATIQGKWDTDPRTCPNLDLDEVNGLPHWANLQIIDMVRRGIGVDRQSRPSSQEWLEAFLSLLAEGISLCPACQGPLLPSPRPRCPHCNQTFSTLALKVCDQICAINEPIHISRRLLKDPTISSRHATLSSMPPETQLRDLRSKNGTFIWQDNRWVRLTPGVTKPVQAGDRIRFGQVVGLIIPS